MAAEAKDVLDLKYTFFFFPNRREMLDVSCNTESIIRPGELDFCPRGGSLRPPFNSMSEQAQTHTRGSFATLSSLLFVNLHRSEGFSVKAACSTTGGHHV